MSTGSVLRLARLVQMRGLANAQTTRDARERAERRAATSHSALHGSLPMRQDRAGQSSHRDRHLLDQEDQLDKGMKNYAFNYRSKDEKR